MENTLKIRMNVCKSWYCSNLGIADATDYIFPVYRLGYPALECKKCGSLPPLFNEADFNRWFTQLIKSILMAAGKSCPRCYAADTIRYGQTDAGSARLQCRTCRTVFTPHRPTPRQQKNIDTLLSQLSLGHYSGNTPNYRTLIQAGQWCEPYLNDPSFAVAGIATVMRVFPFQGKKAQQSLYVVMSADTRSGRIIQVTTNYCDWIAGDSLHYRGSGNPPPEPIPANTVEHIREQEMRFMQRSQFDEIHYGSAIIKHNDRGSILRPVIVIHGHFQRLKRQYPAVTDHYLAHECVLRGAAITAWATEVRQGKTHLWFVAESDVQQATSRDAWRNTGIWRLGWWENIWQQWSMGENNKMIGLLTGQAEVKEPSCVSLSSCSAFEQWLSVHPWSQRCNKLSAGVVSKHLICLAYLYNQSLFNNRD